MVRAVRAEYGNETKVEAFSLINNSWHIVEGFDNQIIMLEVEATFLNGALHWLASRDAGPDKSDLIISLDLVQEIFNEISIENNSFHTLGTLDGCLSLLCDGSSVFDVEVWIMKEYGFPTSWTKLTILPAPIFDYYDHVEPVCFAKNGELIVELDGRELLRYNLQDNTAKKLKSRRVAWFIDAVYVESLVSPKAYNGINHQQLRV